MKTITLQEAQQCLPELIVLVEQGEDVFITHESLPTVKLIISSTIPKKRQFGQYAGKSQMSDDFNESLPESFWLGTV
jgi:antitoxin (DNA-binding transcriptional repressor) of toxin-antitoxin stability system